MKCGRNVLALLVLTAMFWAKGGAVSYAAVALDQSEEVQSVMGDLSALKTAAQMYYSDNGSKSRVPPLSSILYYFDEGTLPPDASLLYAIKGDAVGWYVGYRAYGLLGETYRQLEENANSLSLVGDDLRSPWRRGSVYIWSSALTVSVSSGTTVIRESNTADTAIGVAAVLVGVAAFLSIVNDSRSHCYYSYPGQPWRWRSSLAYRPAYRDRFYRRFSHPAPVRPAPSYRKPPELRPYHQRPSRQQPSLQRPPRKQPSLQQPSRQQSPRKQPSLQQPSRQQSPRQQPSLQQPPKQQPSRQQAPRVSEPKRDSSRPSINKQPARSPREESQRSSDNRPSVSHRRTK